MPRVGNQRFPYTAAGRRAAAKARRQQRRRPARNTQAPMRGRNNNRAGVGQHTHTVPQHTHRHLNHYHETEGGSWGGTQMTGYSTAYGQDGSGATGSFTTGRAGVHRHGGVIGGPGPRPITAGGRRRRRTTYKRRR